MKKRKLGTQFPTSPLSRCLGNCFGPRFRALPPFPACGLVLRDFAESAECAAGTRFFGTLCGPDPREAPVPESRGNTGGTRPDRFGLRQGRWHSPGLGGKQPRGRHACQGRAVLPAGSTVWNSSPCKMLPVPKRIAHRASSRRPCQEARRVQSRRDE
jgi:hypothetical protein